MIFNRATNEQIKRILSELANYLPKSGGMVGTGSTTIPFGIKGQGGSSYTSYFNHDESMLGFLGMNRANKPSYMPADRSTTYDLLHTGNKPSGTYTGNGSITSRYFSVPSTSKALVIYSNYGVVFVFNTFFVIIPINGEIIRGTGGVNYDGTTLGFYSTETWLNASGVTYTYYVL